MADYEYSFRLARQADRAAIIEFMNAQWDVRHPIVNLPDFFDYYFLAPAGGLNVALAERDGALCALAGFVPASIKIKPDIWVSLWVADPGAKGCGLELMAALPQLTGCGTLACNNIRPNTRIFYEFLGYTTGRMGHFYRLADQVGYTLARISHKEILPVGGSAQLVQYHSVDELRASGFIPPERANPYKDAWYIERRFYAYPGHSYRVFGVLLPGSRTPAALLCTRVIEAEGRAVLRIADFIGAPALLPECGRAIDGLMEALGIEYTDLYCAGIDAALLAEAGFSERVEGDENILPNYLNPPLYQNTEYYYFTSKPEGFVMFKADGDQDRPNLPVPQP